MAEENCQTLTLAVFKCNSIPVEPVFTPFTVVTSTIIFTNLTVAAISVAAVRVVHVYVAIAVTELASFPLEWIAIIARSTAKIIRQN